MISLRRDARLRNEQAAPLDWKMTFGREAPIEVDLGCGRGDYAWDRATGFLGIDMVALDVRHKWISRLQERCRREGVSNLRAVRCDVVEDLLVLFPANSVSVFTIHHPDPWWKKRHRKRRMVRPALIDQLAQLLVPGGLVYLQTDVPELAEEMRSLFASRPDFSSVDAPEIHTRRLGGVRSHREKRCLRLGIPVSRLAYELRPRP